MKPTLGLLALLLVGCVRSASRSASLRVAPPTPAADRAALLDRMKRLEGTWETTGPEGTVVGSVFTITSNGLAVRELMFPGTQHEMTNMYTMEGPSLRMTHYCALGNQPRMLARAEPGSQAIRFESDGVSNFQQDHPAYMGSMTLTIVDDDHVKADWYHFQRDGKEHGVHTFELTRKR